MITLPKPKRPQATGLNAKPDFLVGRKLDKPAKPPVKEEPAPEPTPEPEAPRSKVTVITGEDTTPTPAAPKKDTTSIYERWAKRVRKPAHVSMQDGVAQILAFNEWIERDRPVFRHPFMAPLVRVDKLPGETKKAIMHIWTNGTDDDRRRLLINDPPDTTGDIEHTEPETDVEPTAGKPAATDAEPEPVPVDKAGARLIKKLQALQEREGAADGVDEDEMVAMITMPIIIVNGRLQSRTQRALAEQRACTGRMESYTTIGKCQMLSLDRDLYDTVLAEMDEAGNDCPTFQEIITHLRGQKAYRSVPKRIASYNLIAPVNTPHKVKGGRIYLPLMPAVFNEDGSYIDSWTFPRK